VRVNSRRAVRLVPDLALDESPVNPVLSQVRDVRYLYLIL